MVLANQLLNVKEQKTKEKMKTRLIQTEFWNDEQVQEMSLEGQHLYLFLLTCPQINICGIFKLSRGMIQLMTRLSAKQLTAAARELSNLDKVRFYKDWISVVNARAHNFYETSPKNAKACQKELESIPADVLDYFQKDKTSQNIHQDSNDTKKESNDTISTEYRYSHNLNHNQNQKDGGVGEEKNEKAKQLALSTLGVHSHVCTQLTDIGEVEIQTVAKAYRTSPAFVRDCLDNLRNYCESSGKRYKNYLAALRNFTKAELNRGAKNVSQLATPSLFQKTSDNPDLARQSQMTSSKKPTSVAELQANREKLPPNLRRKLEVNHPLTGN